MPDNQKEPTIRDLAALLNLSVATVSRALNDDDNVRPQTKKRVSELAEQVGYRFNDYAKSLRNGQSGIIGCIVPHLDSQWMSAIVSGIEKATRRQEYSLIVTQSHGNYDTEVECAEMLFTKRVEGMVVAQCGDKTRLGHLSRFIRKAIPVVLLEPAGSDQGFVNIVIDNARAGYDLTRHLLSRGRRRILHLTGKGPDTIFPGGCDGYRQAHAEAGIPVAEQYMMVCGLSRQDGVAAVETVMHWAEKPDAILALSDHCALGCMEALKSRGVRIPEEIAVAGFGNDPISTLSEPDLTTMGYPGQRMGETAINHLMHRLHGTVAGGAVSTVILRRDLILRRSTN